MLLSKKGKPVFFPLLKRPLEGKKYMQFPNNSSSYDYSIPSPALQNSFQPNQLLSSSKPQSYMFKQMRYSPPTPHFSNMLKPIPTSRAALSIDKSTDILDHIYSLPHPAQEQAQAAVRAIETAAMVDQEPQPGLNELIAYLESRSVRMGLCTRNFEYSID